MLRRIFGPRRDEVTGEWRRFHNEELNNLYCSLNFVRVIKSRRMRWAGHVARMGEETEGIGSRWGNRREGDHWGDLFVKLYHITRVQHHITERGNLLRPTLKLSSSHFSFKIHPR